MNKPDVKCSRCDFPVHGNADNYDIRKKRHADKHKPHTTISERTGSMISLNNDVGPVTWITIW